MIKVTNTFLTEELNVIKKIDQQMTEICSIRTSDDENNINIDEKMF